MRFCLTLAIVLIVVFPITALAGSPSEGQAETTSDFDWLYDSPLTVVEEISLGPDGLYAYSYRFENTDKKNIWHFGVYATF